MKTIVFSREAQRVLDELRGRLAVAGHGVLSESATIAEALKRWAAEAAREDRAAG